MLGNLGLCADEGTFVFGVQEVEHYEIREVLRCTIIFTCMDQIHFELGTCGRTAEGLLI